MEDVEDPEAAGAVADIGAMWTAAPMEPSPLRYPSGGAMDWSTSTTRDPAPLSQLRVQVVDALRAILRHAEFGNLDPSPSDVGTSLIFEHDNVRCVVVVGARSLRQNLSPRELQIAGLVADGATNRAIASVLDISLWTVSTHLRRIFAKLDVGCRAEMVAQLYGAPSADRTT